MSTNYHTPIATGAARTAANINGPLGQLDAEITTLVASVLASAKVWAGKTTAPTVNDDSGDGIAVGDRWIDETNNIEYVCLDATVGAAIWRKLGSAVTPYQLVVSVASGNITLALKNENGDDPTPSAPVRQVIGGVLRTVSSALSVTVNAGVSTFNSGSSMLATKLINYFVYLGYNSTDGVTLGFSRIPYALSYGDFSTTATNGLYAKISTITNAVSTDKYIVIGRFSATLSAGAAYTWSIPGTGDVINHPIFDTDVLSYSPASSLVGLGWAATPTVAGAFYQISRTKMQVDIQNATGTSNDTIMKIPLPLSNGTSIEIHGILTYGVDNGSALTAAARFYAATNAAEITVQKDMAAGAWTNTGTKTAYLTANVSLK